LHGCIPVLGKSNENKKEGRMPTDIADTEITLHVNDLQLKASPYGASLRGLWRDAPNEQQNPIITGYTGATGKVGGQGDVLIPFPGRVRDGRYTFDGQTYQMLLNDKEGPNAIHGFLRLVAWETVEQRQDTVTFAVSLRADEHPGYPFALRSTVSYALDDQGMICRFTIENTGDRPAPVAAGFHPYFTVGSPLIDADLLHVPMAATLEFEDLLPTGHILPVDGTPYDFRQPRPIGDTAFNTCYLNPLRDPDGLLRLGLVAPNALRAVTVWLDGAFNYVVLYSGDPLPPTHRRRALAIEPMTCASDAFNHPEWGLTVLAPTGTLTGAWGVTVGS
jgi:aldose 1-epimerase